MKKILGLFFVIVVTASAAFAGDWAEMRFFGFSEDGKYLAFEEYGEWDVHGGGDYANTYFIDVDKNVYAIAPVAYSYSDNDEKTTGEYSQEAQKARYKAAVAAGMKRFHIVAGNTGKLVAAHMTSDHSFDKPQTKIGEYYTKDG
ncbi:MAG TPA: hypothetical protein VHQ01_13055, partial [Pyrinomonadaceae bacterium]|nr:hypothetical protein [Pyrinomonadaceae bacterium]